MEKDANSKATVQYVCCCGSCRPIGFTYFCRHCLRLRCHYCVSHEVDSHYCGNCSENMPSAEAKLRKNRCNSCWDCPICKLTLCIRAITINTPVSKLGGGGEMESQKYYFLACGFCRWTSRDAGMPDATSINGPWKEAENPDNDSLDKIGEYFRLLGQREKNSDKKYVQKSKYLAAGRHGLAHLLPKRLPGSGQEETLKALPPPYYLAPAVGLDELPDETEEFYLDLELNMPKITTLPQRLSQNEAPPRHESQLLPSRKHLLIKRSLRCRVCERNIMKPEYSPASIKFKIQLNAFFHVPQVRLMAPLSTSPQLQPGDRTTIILRVSNPTQFPTTLKFLPFSFVPLRKNHENKELIQGLEALSTESSTDASLSLTFTPQQQTIKEITVLPINDEYKNYTLNCRLVSMGDHPLVILPPRDETSDFDDLSGSGESPDYNDDPNFIPWRKANKVGVKLEIERIRLSDFTEIEEPEDQPLTLGLTVEYDYTNTITALDSKSGILGIGSGGGGPQKVRIQTHCLITLN